MKVVTLWTRLQPDRLAAYFELAASRMVSKPCKHSCLLLVMGTPTSGSGPPGGTLRVGGHVSTAHNYYNQRGAPRRQAPPIGKGGKEVAPNMSWENILGAGERWRYD